MKALLFSWALLASAALCAPAWADEVPVRGGHLYAESCGAGADVIVLMHDGVVNSRVWDEVWPRFCRHARVIRYDRRGFGRSPAATAPYRGVDDLEAVLKHYEVARADLVGSSGGGRLAIDFTLAHPERVGRLVLVASPVGGARFSDAFMARNLGNSAPLKAGNIAAALTNWANDPYLVAPSHRRARARLKDLLMASPQDLTHADPAVYADAALPRLGEIQAPTLVLEGDGDIADMHVMADRIASGIPRAQHEVVKGVGHMMYLEQPARFSRRVLGFLKSAPSSASVP